MEVTEKPWEREGEERQEYEVHEEEEVRERRRVISNGGSFKKEERAVEEQQQINGAHSEEEERSIFFDPEKGQWKCQHCDWTYQSLGPSIKSVPKHEEFCEMATQVETFPSPHFFFDSPKYEVADSNLHIGTNGTASVEILAAPKEMPTSKLIQSDNGSSSKSESHSSLFATREEGSTSNPAVNIKEFDLEKVLEEQETHDLYCPNCNSCITRRVILKKRKRIAKDVKSDFRPEKFPNLGPIETVNVNLDEREQTNVLFKCLSCFTFFIPTDCGFDICHLFGGKKESPPIPSSAQNEEEIHSVIATQHKEQISSTITAHREDSQSTATSETKDEIQITVNQQALNQSSDGNNYNWFLGLFHPGDSQKIVTQPDKFDREPFKVAGEKLEENKISVFEEQKTDAAASSKESSLSSASEIIEIKEKKSDIKINTAKVPDLSYIVTRPVNPTEVVHTVNVGLETQEGKGPAQVTPNVPVPGETVINMPKIRPRECCCPGLNLNNWDILKPIVYGGLVESIASLSIVSSAASTGASTLNILLLAAANLIGGLILIIHDLCELKRAQDEADDRNEDELGRYWALLGRKGHFGLHATVAVLAYMFFGLLPPLVYGFTFRETDNSEYKLIAVAIASLVCIAILGIGKAHVRPHRTYFTTMLYYITIGVTASGLSYVAGMLLKQLVESLGLFDQGSSSVPSPPSPLTLFSGTNIGVSSSWASF